MSSKRFAIAVSFASEDVAFVSKVVTELANELGKDRIFYYPWYEHELGGPDGDLKLRRIYIDESEMVVPFFSESYRTKKWCQVEWSAIRSRLLQRRKEDLVIPVGLDDTVIDGWEPTDFSIRRKQQRASAIAKMILKSFRHRTQEHLKSAPTSKPVDPSEGQNQEPTEPQLSSEQLIPIAAEILDASAEARSMIVRYNSLPTDLTAMSLAREMLSSKAPMTYLFECVDRPLDDVEPSRLVRRKQAMLALTEVFAPVCLTLENLAALHQTLAPQPTPFAKIETRDVFVAKAVVGYIKGLPIDGNEPNQWERLCAGDLRSGRNFVTALPEPPELGVRGNKAIAVFSEGLARFLQPRSNDIGAINAAIRTRMAKKVHLCVLFTEPPSLDVLAKIKEHFQDLILLVAGAKVESHDNYFVLDQIKQVREFFRCEDAK